MEPAEAPELPPHYYLDNFLVLCQTVEKQYGDLLTDEELGFLKALRALPFDAQCLFVRLISRVGPWFRESRLNYPELTDIAAAIDSLLEAGLAVEDDELTLEELGALYTRPELESAFKASLSRPLPKDKPTLLAAIEEQVPDAAVQRAQLATIDPLRIVAPCGFEEVQLLQLLFFGNRYQSLTDFVLSDLGVARYYPYTLDRQHRLFAHREALEEYQALSLLSDCWYEFREAGDGDAMVELAEQLLPLDVQFSSSKSRWFKLCNGLARDLERLAESEIAARLYQRSERHPARERRLRIMEREEDWQQAVKLGNEILKDPWCEEERDAAERIMPRLHRRLGEKATPRRRDNFSKMSLCLPRGDASVELLTAHSLSAQWSSVHYVENALMNTLFGLAFWQQIFSPVPGAFHNPFQGVPADMYSGEFRTRREALIAQRLQELRGADHRQLLIEAYREYGSFQCRWVDQRRVDEPLLEAATRIIPREHLLAVWERILFDPRENRRGFPDLVALGEEPGQYCLIEVKGPGDALQESQKRWLRFFERSDIPAAVAWVEWQSEAVDSADE